MTTPTRGEPKDSPKREMNNGSLTRDELAAMISATPKFDQTYGEWAADVVLPLLAERDTEIERLRAELQQLGNEIADWRGGTMLYEDQP